MQLSNTGRIAILTAYWSAVSLGALALLFSIVGTLWGPRQPPAEANVAQRRTWCVGQAALLHAELRQETRAAFGAGDLATPAQEQRRQRWQRRWNHRFDAVSSQCHSPTDVAETLHQVGTLARRYDAIVTAWHGAEDALALPIEASLRHLADPWPQAASMPAPTP